MSPRRDPRGARRSAADGPRAHPPLADEVYLKRQRDMILLTRGRRSGKIHRVKLWFVHEAGRLYLMAYARRHGRGTDWYQNLRRGRDGVMEAGERRYRVTWELIGDQGTALTRITDLFSGKYGRQMIASYYLETKRFPVCLRVIPAQPNHRRGV